MASQKKKQVRKPVSPAVFNLLNGPTNVIAAANEAMHALRERRKNQPSTLATFNEIRRSGIPLSHFYLQYAFGLAYIPGKCVVELMGKAGVGKTTLLMTLLGEAARANVPAHYQEIEEKTMLEEQIKRCLSTNKAEAQAIFDKAIAYARPREIRQSVKELEEWAMTVRGKTYLSKTKLIPDENPIVAAIDTWSKLMSFGQAQGYMDYADYMGKEGMKALKDVGEGSNLEHAKAAHWWCRRLPYFLGEFNMTLFWLSHQNTKIDMGGGKGGSTLGGHWADLYNIAKIGGNASDQNAALQIVIAAADAQVKDGSGDYIGRTIYLRVHKNSFGPRNRIITYDLIEKYPTDTDTYQEPVLRFDEGMAKWFAEQKILNTTADKKRYSCEALGCIGATAEDLSKSLHSRPDIMRRLAKDLCIAGYDTAIEDLPPPPPPPLEDEKTDPGLRA